MNVKRVKTVVSLALIHRTAGNGIPVHHAFTLPMSRAQDDLPRISAFAPKSNTSVEPPYSTVRVCVRSFKSPSRTGHGSPSQGGRAWSSIDACVFHTVWLSFASNIRWIPDDSAASMPLTLVDFRGAPCLLLTRLPKRSTWDDVNKHVRIEHNKDGPYLVVHGTLQSKQHSRPAEVAILATEGQHLNCTKLLNMVYMRIAPWELLVSAILAGEQGPVHATRVNALHKQLTKLSENSELNAVDQNHPKMPDSILPTNTPSSSSEVPSSAVKILVDYLGAGSEITDRIMACIGTSASTEASNKSDVPKGVSMMSTILQMISAGVQTAVLARETRRGAKHYLLLLHNVVRLFRELTKIIGTLTQPSVSREEVRHNNIRISLRRTMEIMERVERKLLRCKLARTLAGYDFKEVPDGLGILYRNTLRNVVINAKDFEELKRGEEELPEEFEMRPRLNKYFSGRGEELNDLIEKLETYGKALITQYGGVGKTQLMVLTAEEVEDKNIAPGGVFWITVDRDDGQILSAIASFVEAISCKNMNLEERADRGKVLCKLRIEMEKLRGRWLLCLDNVDNPDDNGIIADIYNLASPEKGWVILASRKDACSFSGVVEKEQVVQVQPLSEQMSMVVLWRTQIRKSRKEVSDEEVYRNLLSNEKEHSSIRIVIMNLNLNGLPLALHNVRVFVSDRDFTFGDYVKFTEERESEASLRSILRPSTGACGIREEQRGIWSTWKKSMERLDSRAIQVMNVMALFASSEIPGDLIRRVVGYIERDNRISEIEVLKCVKQSLVHETSLVQAHEGSGPVTFRIHPLIRRFILSKLCKQNEAFRTAVSIGTRVLHENVAIEMRKKDTYMHEPPVALNEDTELLFEHSRSMVRRSWAIPIPTPQRKGKFQWLAKYRKKHEDGTPSVENDCYLDSLHFFIMNVSRQQGKWTEALQTGSKLLDRFDRRFSSETDAAEKSVTLQTIGKVFRDQGKLNEAEEMLEVCLEMDRRLLGRGVDGLNLSITLHDLATIKEKRNMLNEAGGIFRESLAMLYRLLGKQADHKQIALTINRLAVIQWRQGYLNDSEKMLRKCLQMQFRLYGEENACNQVSITLEDMALVKRDQGKLADAERLFRESLAMKRKVFGKSAVNIHIAGTLKNLGSVQKLQGSIDDAEKTLRECMAMYEMIFSRNSHPQVSQPGSGRG